MGVLIGLVGGYILSVYTWPVLRGWYQTNETQIAALEAQLAALKTKITG